MLPLLSTRLAVTSVAFTRRRHTSDFSLLLIYKRLKDERLSWPGWLTVADGLPTIVVTHQLRVARRTGIRQPETDVLCYATNWTTISLQVEIELTR